MSEFHEAKTDCTVPAGMPQCLTQTATILYGQGREKEGLKRFRGGLVNIRRAMDVAKG